MKPGCVLRSPIAVEAPSPSLPSTSSPAQQGLSLTEIHGREGQGSLSANGEPSESALPFQCANVQVDAAPSVDDQSCEDGKFCEGAAESLHDDIPRPEQGSFGLDDAFSGQVKVPGARASPVRIQSVWNSMTRSILKSRTKFSNFLAAMLRKPHRAIGKQVGSTAPAWPMPLPFPVHEDAPGEADGSVAFHKLINLQVAFMNYLHLGKPAAPPQEICGDVPLSSKQWDVIHRLCRLGGAWQECGVIHACDMGRVASKQEQQEDVVRELTRFAMPVPMGEKSNNRCKKASGKMKMGYDHGEHVGRLSKQDISGCQQIVASRIKMEGTPSFDPRPFLDDKSRTLYENPWCDNITPADIVDPPPRVRVYADTSERMALLHKLEDTGRLGFRSASDVIPGFGNGLLFCVPKSTEVDRLILDGRPANLLQIPPNRFIYTMAAAETLTGIYLPPDEQLVMSGDDLSIFFYTFAVGKDRISRNFLEWRMPTKLAQRFKSFPAELADEEYVYPCLASLAMGDSAACEYAQTAHIALGLQCGAFTPQQLVTLHGRVPRDKFMAGIIIDDFVLLERVARDALQYPVSEEHRARMHKMYQQVGLDAHPTKGFAGQCKASFWGADVDGSLGLIRGNVVRAVSLCWVTTKVAQLGICSVNLLEVIAGAFVS